jgi:8-oxo-dGTP pyrophosphatase MutT (NUDIX family)
MSAFSEHFLSDPVKLTAADAVAAMLVLDDGRYVMQLRDDKRGIFYPGHWGCFGGAVNPGEPSDDALRRELQEELEFDVGDYAAFTRFDFDFSPMGGTKVYRIYYDIRVPAEAYARFVLHEGAEFGAFTARELLEGRQLVPYDAFALWLHTSRTRVST